MALAAFPADGIATLVMPSSLAIDTAQDRPRALNEPVGLIPSSFTHRFCAPRRSPERLARISGVIPSPSDTIDADCLTGNTVAYRHILRGPLTIDSRFQFRRALSRS